MARKIRGVNDSLFRKTTLPEPPAEGQKTKAYGTRLPVEYWERFDAICRAENTNRHELMRNIMIEFIEDYEAGHIKFEHEQRAVLKKRG